MGFFSSIADFLAKPFVSTVANFATGLLGQKGASDRNEQQIAMTRKKWSGKSACLILRISAKLRI